MPTTVNLRPLLDRKQWEFCTPPPTATSGGAFVVSTHNYKQPQLYVASATVHYLYSPLEDAYTQIPSGALAGAFGAGACGVASNVGPSGTATAGTTTTITTNLTLARDLRGYSIHITGGPNAGVTLPIVSNTVAPNSVITVAAQSAAFTASTTYRLLTPRWYVLNAIAAAGTTTAGVFRYYDFALNTWTSLAANAPAAAIGTDSVLVATPSWIDTAYKQFATGTATAGAATTLTNTAKNWAVNQWANYQVRIVGGTGAGQIRTIASNTATVLTVSSAWTTNPDATSTYSIEGNDDFLYYIGSGAVTLYRYSISGSTWSTLSPTAARAAAASSGTSGVWVHSATDSTWTDENNIQNGRYIYSFRGGVSSALDRYDIAANTWSSALSYAPATETFTSGTKYVYIGNSIYIQKDATGRWFRHNVVTSEQEGWSTMLYPNGTAVLGNTAWDCQYVDGATTINYVYMILNTSSVVLRAMVI